ncbi:MAG TPA: hypothetical protein VMB27_07665 [Solirubrobacteraceae bacterium]|nr:hypothetical protein [Solirubrobacteraceae bacterium]
MNPMSDMSEAGTYEDEGALDPHGAARLLARTQRQAQRELDFRSPWLSLIAAGAALIGFGAVWLSVRHQHPFKGPTTAALVVLYLLVAIRIGTVLYAHHRASAGVSGRSARLERAEGVGLAAALVAVYVLMIALVGDGVGSQRAFYWLYGVTATLIVLGTFWAARSAVKEDWPELGMSMAIMLVAAGSALAGPRGVWLGDGVGLCVLLVASAGAQMWLLRTSRSGT